MITGAAYPGINVELKYIAGKSVPYLAESWPLDRLGLERPNMPYGSGQSGACRKCPPLLGNNGASRPGWHVLRASAPVAILVSPRKGHSTLSWRPGALSPDVVAQAT
jgi:hypothetical protein